MNRPVMLRFLNSSYSHLSNKSYVNTLTTGITHKFPFYEQDLNFCNDKRIDGGPPSATKNATPKMEQELRLSPIQKTLRGQKIEISHIEEISTNAQIRREKTKQQLEKIELRKTKFLQENVTKETKRNYKESKQVAIKRLWIRHKIYPNELIIKIRSLKNWINKGKNVKITVNGAPHDDPQMKNVSDELKKAVSDMDCKMEVNNADKGVTINVICVNKNNDVIEIDK